MDKRSQWPQVSLIALAVIQYSPSMASSIDNESLEAYTYSSRGTGQFLAGGNQQLGGFADGMVPVWQRPNQVFFADGTVLLGQNQRQTYSGGLGYRRLHENGKMAGIWGVYSFVDYFHTDKNNEFWLLNPGVEWLSTDYEARLQGYFPLNGRTKTYQTVRASNIPQDVANSANQMTSNFFGLRGRRVFDSNMALVEQIGPGIELEVGKSFMFNQMKFGHSETNRAWLHVGGYLANSENGDATARGISSPDVEAIDTNISTTAISTGVGSPFAQSVFAKNAVVSGGVYNALATSISGFAAARGMVVEQKAIITKANTSALAVSSEGISNARNIFVTNGDAVIVGGEHVAEAISQNNQATARSIEANNKLIIGANDIQTFISAMASSNSNTAQALGAFGGSGEIVNTVISLDSNGSKDKCSGGVTSPDGSC